ncbi:hypothetical protein ABZ281_25755 [Streptomyces sp. NPDC006265]|uniref:hypothetical protein n=1 Tax=Streptomyces sp. NPDC006265 TaxID=3156740 RepID=UPI0033AF3688
MALAVACAALTVTSFPPVRDAVERVLGSEEQPAPYAWEFALSGALAVAVSAVIWIRGPQLLSLPSRITAPALEWLRLETAARMLLVSPVLRLADVVAAFDERVLDRAVEDIARASVRLAQWTNAQVERLVDGAVEDIARASVRLAQWTNAQVERLVDGAVEAVAGGARALGRLARRPQTGQLHQYLAQAVAAFTLLAVVLVLVR